MMRIQTDCFESYPTRLNPSSANLVESTINRIKTFPNPFNTELTIESDENLQSYELFSANGMKLCSEIISGTKAKLNTETLSEGIYYLNIYTTIGKTIQKIVK
jgi:hypothetical protein